MQMNRLEVVRLSRDKARPQISSFGNTRRQCAARRKLPVPGRRRQTATTHQLAQSLVLWRSFPRCGNVRERREHLCRGDIEQRQFTPKADGVQRIVNEVVVRHCHLIAAPRGAAARGARLQRRGAGLSRIFRKEPRS